MGITSSKHTLTLKSLQQKRLPPSSLYDKNYFQNQYVMSTTIMMCRVSLTAFLRQDLPLK